ncbi:MAG: hypothetical protein ABIA04_10315 [Pseudomonadota bacterium]
MRFFKLFFILISALSLTTSCGSLLDSSSGGSEAGNTTVDFTLRAQIFDSAIPSLFKNIKFTTEDDPTYQGLPDGASAGCWAPDVEVDDFGTGYGIPLNISPTTYKIAFKRVTLLSDSEDYDDVDLINVSSFDEAVVADIKDIDGNNTVTLLDGQVTLNEDATYTGFEIEFYYIEMGLPHFIVPGIDPENESTDAEPIYSRMVFTSYAENDSATDNAQKRDFLILDPSDEEYKLIDNDGEFMSLDSDHRGVDLFADAIWDNDPVILSTESSEGGMSFSFNGTITAADVASEVTTLKFDVGEAWSSWSYMDSDYPDGYDYYDFSWGNCGIHPMLPIIEVENSEEAEATE